MTFIVFAFSCDNGHSIKVPPVESYVMVLQPQQPSITINGSNNVAREYNDFRGGVRIFPDLRISVDDDNKQSKACEFSSNVAEYARNSVIIFFQIFFFVGIICIPYLFIFFS